VSRLEKKRKKPIQETRDHRHADHQQKKKRKKKKTKASQNNTRKHHLHALPAVRRAADVQLDGVAATTGRRNDPPQKKNDS
jgi:hypothetical protein